MERKFDVISVGELNADIILSLDREPELGKELMTDKGTLTLGSSTALCSVAMARLGLDVGFFGKVGPDVLGRFVVDALESLGVDGSMVRSDGSATGFTVSLSYPTDRALVTFSGSISELTESDIPDDVLMKGRHLHVASLFLQKGMLPGWIDLLRRAKSLGLTVSSDCGWDPEEKWDLPLAKLLEYVDVFLPSESELLAWTKASSVSEALSLIDNGRTTIVVKLGSKGAVALHQGQRYEQPSFPVVVQDTTGAGDAFNAGYVWAFLNGHTVSDCLRFAAACGALAVSTVGAGAAFDSAQDVEAFLARG